MSGFLPLNPEDRIDDGVVEVDETREIQIEDALKLYQNALKLHSQGPLFREQAAQAYEELFASEVFRYPEALSQFTHDELATGLEEEGPVTISDDTILEPTATTDGQPSSLPQILHLAFKNRGQFALDRVENVFSKLESSIQDPQALALAQASRNAIGDFAEALERDDTDIDLWRKSARVSDVLSSKRLARFCLESVFVGDDGTVSEDADLLGLDEALAIGDLRDVLKALRDDLSTVQLPNVQAKDALYATLKKRLDPYPYMPSRLSRIEYFDARQRPLGFQPIRHPLRPANRSWLAVGTAIYHALSNDGQYTFDLGPGAALAIDLPGDPDGSPVRELEFTTAPATQHSTSSPAEQDAQTALPQNNVETHGNSSADQAEAPEPNEVAESASIDEQAAAQLTGQMAEAPLQEAEAAVSDDRVEKTGIEGQSLPVLTRKRSSASAGNDDAGRVKSKRLRAREANVEANTQEEDTANNLAQFYEDQHEELARLDRWMFSAASDLLVKCDVEELGSLDDLKQVFVEGDRRATTASNAYYLACCDLRESMMSWKEEHGHAIISGQGAFDIEGQLPDTENGGLTTFLEHSKPATQKPSIETAFPDGKGLDRFANEINDSWTYGHHAALRFIESLLFASLSSDAKDSKSKIKSSGDYASSYLATLWPPALKQLVVQIINREDEYLHASLSDRLKKLEERLLKSTTTTNDTWTEADTELAEMVQTLFELHLDIYCLITHPNSEVDRNTRLLQRDRLGRWAEMSSELLTRYSNTLESDDLGNTLVLRFMWASTTHATKAEDVSKDHVILCLQELRMLIREAGEPVIILQNNAAMPEISATAVEQQISRLSTLEFFEDVFSNDSRDPQAVIDRLEPLLDPNLDPVAVEDSAAEGRTENVLQDTTSKTTGVKKLRIFLDQGGASLKLFLWRRLEEAYKQINHQPMMVSCSLRSIETVMDELQAGAHIQKSNDERQIALLRWLVTADKLIVRLLKVVLNEADAFDNIYYEHLQCSMTAIARLCRLLHSFALLDDSFRIGDLSPPLTKGSSTRLLEKTKDKLREMQVRAWVLQYALIKEGITQNKALFNSPHDDRARYLCFIHNAFGARGYCRYSNKLLLKIMKEDLLNMPTEDDYEADISQVLFDLYQMKLVSGPGDANHECPAETLDRPTALKIVPLIMTQANRMNIRDLIKSDLKATIDKVQLVIGAAKNSSALSHNRKMIQSFVKSAINPRDLYQSMQGVGDLPTKPVQGDIEAVASQGWYYLQGYMALAKFKSIKRVSPTPTVDLDIANAFFKQDVEHGMEKWETWYRWAQTYEARLEDDILWTAEKLNNTRSELVIAQRAAIHCYSMSLAVAIRNIDDSPDCVGKISDLLTELATLLYAASREPLSMEAFSLEGFERHYSSDATQQMYKATPFPPMQPYSIWNFSSYLLRRAITSKPRRWINHYLLGKCLWKMYTQPANASLRSVPSAEEIVASFAEAVNTLPERRDSRAEPVLEPHFKLVSVVHKLVHKGRLTPTRGSEVLQTTTYARKEHLSLDDEDGEGEGWDAYVLKVLHNLEKADKSNWHHRIIARTAHIHYDDNAHDPVAALAARHQFTQQIFTKTMSLQVWKPENERPGRHFVYTSRYVLFFVNLLDQLNDRSSLEALARRIRKKQNDFLDHATIWAKVCETYIRVLRRAGKIPEGYMDTIFKPIHYEVFGRTSEALEKWAHDSEDNEIRIDILREALELKKLNNNLMKTTVCEDLVADTYAGVYEVFIQSQTGKEIMQGRGPEQPSATPSMQAVTPNLRGVSAEPGSQSQSDEQTVPAADSTKLPVHSMLVSGTQVDGSHEDPSATTAPNPSASSAWPQRQPSPGPYGNPPFHVHTSGQAPSAVVPPKPHLGRPKQITRREVQRKAEAILGKPPPIPTPKLLNAPGLPVVKGRIAVEIPASPSVRKDRATDNDPTAPRTNTEGEENKQSPVEEGDRADKGITSRRSSTGDRWDQGADADNEIGNSSELSEIEEEGDASGLPMSKPTAKLMFPNLVKADAADSSTIASEDASMAEMGDEAEEEEGEEGEGDDTMEGEAEGQEGEEGTELEQGDEQDGGGGEEENHDQSNQDDPMEEGEQ
ncbi:MAG: hypothetical protein Q9160_008096 [Pyrenula sp. 1 TL-2023]